MPSDLIIVNPLGRALAHYTQALELTCSREGRRVSSISIEEPSANGQNRVVWLVRYARALRRARARAMSEGARVLVAWPAIGHLDRIMIRLVVGDRVQNALVMHDPLPLVRALGYGKVSRWFGARARNVEFIVHSDLARRALTEGPETTQPTVLPHPVLVRQVSTLHTADRPRSLPVVRVLGQYKSDRDIGILTELGHAATGRFRTEIIGRGWPRVDGWEVTDDFVSEQRLDELITTADVVLIPYRRFFQSGVAIRSLELGTPAVGPAESSLADLYRDGRYLAGPDVQSWLGAIEAAAEASRSEVLRLADRAARDARSAWNAWLET